jgi:hypothetical protein
MPVRPLAEADGQPIDDHGQCVMVVVMAARALETHDIEGAIERAKHALEIGPFFQPTAWIQNHEKLEQDIEVLRAALPLVKLAREIRERIEKGELNGFSPEDR